MKILEYLSLHQIIGIGIEYSDIIVDNPFDFADDMASMHYFVTEILSPCKPHNSTTSLFSHSTLQAPIP